MLWPGCEPGTSPATGNEARPDQPCRGDISKSEGRKIERVFMEISIFEGKKKKKRRTKLGCIYINMEMKAVSQALYPPHGQPRSPPPFGISSPFAAPCSGAPSSHHPLPSSSSACSSLLFFSKALLYIQQLVGFASGHTDGAHPMGAGWMVEVVWGCAASSRAHL